MGARSAAEAQSYFVTQLRRTIGIGVFRADAQLRIRRARELRSRACGPEMRWGVRYAEDADHGDPVANMADEFHRARGPAHSGVVVELTQELGGDCLHCTCGYEQPAYTLARM
jgi:hypothetical protein